MAAVRPRVPTAATRMISSRFEMVLNYRVIALAELACFRLPDHRQARRPVRGPGPASRGGPPRVFVAALPR